MAARHVLTILAVEDLARSVRFYAAAFGWPAEIETPVYVELALPGGMRFGLYQREGFAKNPGRAPVCIPDGAITPAEIYLHVDDLAAECSRAIDAGARLLSAASPRPWGDDVAYLADPDGHLLALAVPGTASLGSS